jgi:nitrite reductase/ring-hydroxylating ferredoxin subunit
MATAPQLILEHTLAEASCCCKLFLHTVYRYLSADEELTMSGMKFLCKAADVCEGSVKQLSFPEYDDEFAVYNLGGEYFVTDDMCTHGMVSLAGGEIEDGQIFCPLHGGAFDIRTGKATEHPCKVRLKTYKVELRGEDIYAELC